MKYEDALKEWGALRLAAARNCSVDDIDRASVRVRMEFDEGYSCCGGSDPNCYCSFAESPSADVAISGTTLRGDGLRVSISAEDFDFATVLAEIVAAADGSVTQ